MSDSVENNEIDNLINQLKENNSLAKTIPNQQDTLKKEDVERFVIEKSGALVNESLEFLRELKVTMNAASLTDPEQISALASLAAATTSAIETLNKLVISDKRNETTIKAKHIEMESRKLMAEESPVKLLVTREELLKNLMQTVQPQIKTIDVPSEKSEGL